MHRCEAKTGREAQRKRAGGERFDAVELRNVSLLLDEGGAEK